MLLDPQKGSQINLPPYDHNVSPNTLRVADGWSLAVIGIGAQWAQVSLGIRTADHGQRVGVIVVWEILKQFIKSARLMHYWETNPQHCGCCGTV